VTPRSTTTTVAPSSTPASASTTPAADPSYDGGLLGSVEHLLGGL
jgi:predicted lipid-binding transport protein (Tim44 family)